MPRSACVAAERLIAAAHQGAIDDLCIRLDIELLVIFGSTIRDGEEPRDIDIAVRFAGSAKVLALLEELYDLTGYEAYDVLDLARAGPLARDRALSGGRPLYQRAPGLYATMQIAAMMERMDTAPFRQMQLELMP